MELNRKLKVSGRIFDYGIERGYLKLGIIQKDENGNIIREEKGGWVSDPERGRLFVAALAIKDGGFNITGAGWTEKDAVKNLRKDIQAYLRIHPEVLAQNFSDADPEEGGSLSPAGYVG
jgi:hypothetical protein